MSAEKHNHEHAAAVAKKLEHLFEGLPKEEQSVISDLVRSALLQAAERYSDAETSGYNFPQFVSGLTGHNAPKLIASLRLPGPLAAHSIPSCASSGLRALREDLGSKG